MPTVLDDIVAGVREDLAERQAATGLEHLQRLVDAAPSAIDAEELLRRRGAVAHRRGQAGQPEQGALADDPRPGRAGRGV